MFQRRKSAWRAIGVFDLNDAAIGPADTDQGDAKAKEGENA
jgi:hypothetical protein